MAVRKSRSLHPHAGIDERARRQVPSQQGIFDKTNSNSRMKTASTRIASADFGHGPRHFVAAVSDNTIGRRFAPSGRLHPGYGCARRTGMALD